jgi:hypothetical protein
MASERVELARAPFTSQVANLDAERELANHSFVAPRPVKAAARFGR